MNKWIDYVGERHSTCPNELLDKKVFVRFRNGFEAKAKTAQRWTWENDGMMSNIVAYRHV